MIKVVLHKKLITILIVLLSCLFIHTTCNGQQASLPTAFYNLKTNTEKAVYLRKFIGDSVSKSAYTQVPYLCHLALGLATANDSLNGMFYQFLGDAYYNYSKNDSATYYYKLSLSTFKNIGIVKKIYLQQSLLYSYSVLNKKDSVLFYIKELQKTVSTLPNTNKEKLSVTNAIATCYADLNKYEEAIKHFQFVIKYAVEIKDSNALQTALVNIGIAYNQIGNNQMATYYTLQSLPYFKSESFNKMVTYANLTDNFISLNKIDSAKFFLLKAETIALNNNDQYSINALALRKASIYIAEKNYSFSEPILQKSLRYFQQQDVGVDFVNCLLIYATLDTLQHKYAKAKEHLLLLNKVAKEMNQKAYLAEDLKLLADVTEHLGDYKAAYDYQKMFIAVSDSIKTEKAGASFAELQTQYETYKKEEQIKLLQQESQIKNLELSAAYRNKSIILIIALCLLSAFGIAWYIRNLRNKNALQQQKVTLEMKALRSQMNPHFIFNSLNSIQKYIWENKREDASEYLTKFARLIRSVLENSLHKTITLSAELEALSLYIEMEHRRNNQKFDYNIDVENNIDVEKIKLPPLLLQPYVENAIWHGLSQKDTRGKLSINIKLNNNELLCYIKDDGIGRTKAAEIKATSLSYKKSLATNISAERIEWLQLDTKLKAAVTITDNYKDGVATGTTVLLTLPILAE